MPTLDQVSAGAAAITQINANEQSMQVAAAYGRRASTSSGLVFGYYGATLQDGSTVANGTITVGASTTTYVVVDRTTGAVSSATSTTNWNNTTDYMQMASLISNGSGITTYTDARPAGGLSSGGGGGGAVSSVNGQTGAVVLEVGDLDDVDLTGLADGDTLVYDLATTSWIPGAGGGGGSGTFIGLTDVPASYSGAMGLPVMVNPGETALQFLGAPNGVSSSFTLAAADAVRTTRVTAAATVTVPPNSSVAFPVGTLIPIRQTTSGTVTIVGGAGVTVNAPFQGSLLGAGAGALLVLEKVGTNEWDLSGDTARTASPITLLTPIAATSGATIDYTGLPPTIREFTMHYSGVSLNGSEAPLGQLGDSGGVETTGYSGGFVQSAAGGAVAVAGSTSGAQMGSVFPAGTSTISGHVTFKLIDASTNTWTWSGNLYDAVATRAYAVSGTKSLSATLDRVRFAATGSATYDAGTVNVSYQ